MSSFNQVILMGNLCREPETKTLQSGTALTEFGLACNQTWKDKNGEKKEDVLFIDVTAFGKQAELISQYFHKGSPIMVVGRLKLSTWESKEGDKRSKISVSLEQFQFIGSRDGGERRTDRTSDQSAPRGGGSRPTRGATQQQQPSFDPSEIPFLWEGRDEQPL